MTVTTTTFDTVMALPFVVDDLLPRNKVKNVTVCREDSLDQETDSNGEIAKNAFARTNQKNVANVNLS